MRVLLTAFHMLPDYVYPLDQDLAFARNGSDYFPFLTPGATADHFYEIIFSDIHNYTISGAKETIFMKFLRSSLGTAPKMRVPRGLLSLSSKTTAFLSKRT